MSDATSELVRAITVNFMNFTLEDVRSRAWASGTFAGVRHVLRFRAEGPAAEADAAAFLDGLEEREFALRGHLLADIALVAQDRTTCPAGPVVRITLEALTVEDA